MMINTYYDTSVRSCPPVPVLVEDPGFRNVKKKTFKYPPYLADLSFALSFSTKLGQCETGYCTRFNL